MRGDGNALPIAVAEGGDQVLRLQIGDTVGSLLRKLLIVSVTRKLLNRRDKASAACELGET